MVETETVDTLRPLDVAVVALGEVAVELGNEKLSTALDVAA